MVTPSGSRRCFRPVVRGERSFDELSHTGHSAGAITMNAQRHPRAMKASTPIPGRRREALGGAFRVARESYRPQLQRCISPACSASTGRDGLHFGGRRCRPTSARPGQSVVVFQGANASRRDNAGRSRGRRAGVISKIPPKFCRRPAMPPGPSALQQ